MAIIITSRIDGRRRAGIAHTAQPVTYDDAYFSAEQLEALQNDPVLEVRIMLPDTESGNANNPKPTKSVKTKTDNQADELLQSTEPD